MDFRRILAKVNNNFSLIIDIYHMQLSTKLLRQLWNVKLVNNIEENYFSCTYCAYACEKHNRLLYYINSQ